MTRSDKTRIEQMLKDGMSMDKIMGLYHQARNSGKWFPEYGKSGNADARADISTKINKLAVRSEHGSKNWFQKAWSWMADFYQTAKPVLSVVADAASMVLPFLATTDEIVVDV